MTTVALHLAAIARMADCDIRYALHVAIAKSNRDLLRSFAHQHQGIK